MGDERDSVCSFCGVVNKRKKLIRCDTCGCLFHLSCVGLTRAQAEAFGRWNCEQCRGAVSGPSPLEWALMFVFLILVAAVGGWTAGVCTACPANTVLAAFQRIRQWIDMIKRALQKARLPSVLEPPGLDRGDGSRPDGITVFPFSEGRSLVWDCTCVDTFAEVHLNRSAMEAGTAANSAEERKRRKYAALAEAHQFWANCSRNDGSVWWVHWSHLEGDRPPPCWSDRGAQEVNWFRQNLAIAIQRGNAFSNLSAGRYRF